MLNATSGLSTGDYLALTGVLVAVIALLLGVVFAASWLFQRLGEERLRNIVALREEVDASRSSLNRAVKELQGSQKLALKTMEHLVRSLDILAAYLEVNGGVIQDILTVTENAGNPNYADVHKNIVITLREANDELHILSPDPERRLSAVKNLGYGSRTYRALESVETATRLYPGDDTLRFVAEQLKLRLRSQKLDEYPRQFGTSSKEQPQ